MQHKERSFKMLGAVTLSAAALALIAWVSPVNYYQMMSDNELTRSLKKKLDAYNEQMPGDRIYLQFDKPMYEPGDNIWFSAFIRDAATMKASGKSDIVHVEFLNPKGTVEKSINIIAKNGVAAGDFTLDAEALGGIYKVRAYTNWMKNEGEDNQFVKEIQVQDVVLPNLKMKLDFEKKAFGAGDEVVAKLELNTNENKPLSNYKIKFVANLDGKQIVSKGDVTDENGLQYLKFNLPAELKTNDGLLNVMIDYNGSTESISRSIPIVLNTVKLQLFPEGGDLVAGLESKVAFRALNEFGKPADIEGIVVTEKGSYVSSFSSFHQGMGAFKFTPKEGEKYSVKITKPENIKETFPMPDALARGYVMDVDAGRSELVLNINTTETEELSLVAQVRNKVYYSTVIEAKKGSNRIAFPTTNFPIGVAQVTLFDSKGIARAERLAFVNKHKQLNISVETEKEKYLPREKVKMTISVKDERGMPMPANLSMAVVNDQFLSFADDKSGNILSELLLQQDLSQKVEEPAFYFSSKEPKADEALDYLLMTAGWRHFTWEKLMSDNLPAATYQGERAIVAGTVLDASTGKIIKNAKIRINNGAEYQTDENGKFIFNKLDLSNPVTLAYSADGYRGQAQYVQNYNQNLQMYLYGNRYYDSYYNIPASSSNVNAIDAAAPGEMLKDSEREVAFDKPMRKRDEDKAMVMNEAKPKAPNKVAGNRKANVAGDLVRQDQQNGAGKDVAKKQEVFAGLAANSGWARSKENMEDDEMNMKEPQQSAQLYYRAKEFAAPVYDKQENVEVRNDFRNTIYWNPDVEIDRSGKKTVEFYASDDITSFRTTVEGIAGDGMPGRTEKNFFTQLPFAMSAKVPVEVATEDNLSIPLTLKNNTDKPLGGLLTVTAPDGFQALVAIPAVQTIMPGAAKTIYLDYKVLDKIGYGDFTLTFKSCGLGDAFTQRIKIAPKGFPAQVSFSSQELEKEYSFSMDHIVKGSVKATFTAFPNVVSDLMKGVEGILQEPYGCFEQTSCTAYPNAMVLDYMKSTDSKDNQTLARATDLLNRGYKRLTTFESSEKGYEWFGANPGHEGLTAYGIMEFTDMKNAGADVDQKMLDRTVAWLLKHRNGKGGFNREQHAYHDFGRISDEILNAYIVYALAEAGYTDIKEEFNASFQKAMDTKDPYMLAMMANAAYSLKEAKKADEAMSLLVSKQAKDGSFTGTTHSITYSQGQSLSIETTSLAIMAMLKSQGKNAGVMTGAVQYLVGARSGSGVFSSTQGTILALKALTEYAKFSKKTTEDGTIEIYVDGKKVAEKSYKAGDKGAIEISGLEEYLSAEGKHDVKIKYVGVKTPLPYSMAVNYNTALPNSNKECSIGLETKLAAKTANVGQTVRLTATITNRKNTEVPSTMAIIGIPAGFTVQPWQLKELQEKKMFDYYEMKGNNIAVYYRGMGPSAVKEINLDLKAEMPGSYDAPASSAYLYYTNEFKTWSATDKITIKKNS
ncbi:MAG: large extracellular alpha-helical protein [Bacteroidetes bacterium]|nr:large extracellular alpha-helical protein [Bacteroidota bacterium]